MFLPDEFEAQGPEFSDYEDDFGSDPAGYDPEYGDDDPDDDEEDEDEEEEEDEEEADLAYFLDEEEESG
jgi:hypothetical protein